MKANFSAAILAVLMAGGAVNIANATDITFDNYGSATNNDLANDFNQTGTIAPSPYVQSPTGGITGGAVVGYTGSEYMATAVYTPSTFNFFIAGRDGFRDD